MEIQKYLDFKGVEYLWSKLSLEDYPNNEILKAVINAIAENKADKTEVTDLKDYVDSKDIAGTPGQFIVIGDDGKPVAKTMTFNTYYKGTSEPSKSLGQDGDLYLVKG